MAKIAVIKDPVDATAILRHLNLWEEPPARGSPAGGTVYEPCYDDLPAAAAQNDQPAAATASKRGHFITNAQLNSLCTISPTRCNA